MDTPSHFGMGKGRDNAVTGTNNLPSHDALNNSNDQSHNHAVMSSENQEFTADGTVNRAPGMKLSNDGLEIQGLDLQNLVAEDVQTILSGIVDILNDPDQQDTFLTANCANPLPTLNLLQVLLDRGDLLPSHRSALMLALTRLAKLTACYPDSLILSGIQRIGENPVAGGGHADIWKGNLNTSCVAMKVLRIFKHSGREKALKDLCHEAVIWRQLKHPNILPFLGVFKGDGSFDHLCLISPWMDGGNVIEYLKRNPDVHRLPLLTDVLNGLAYLHSFQTPVIHGNLIGVNILVTPSQNACIGGFGQLRFQDYLDYLEDTSDNRIGPLRWQAPELLFTHGETAQPSTETDVYSFGCLCLELMTGKPPFSEIRPGGAVIRAIVNRKKPKRPSEDLRDRGLDDNLWSLMTECWDYDPKRRPEIGTLLEFFENRKELTSEPKIFRG
ncbi:kinase-like protein [Rickenella mellea]|uniref:Kinase-like protein n=1 Tax=Rickenella mellea TaxID=50990 RepID=A0A4Y7QAK3_9AGAM|nr:kinase-like protein [Rickenella mellea]